MKVFLKIFLLTAVAYFLLGAYRGISAKEETYAELRYFHEVVHRGDTFNEVISKYYNYDNEKMSWDEWQTKVKQHNKMLFYYSDGSARVLMPNDIICIPARVNVKK